ncbi:hypothetical protein EBR43_11565 [bacterium]|nr:hypothetical protein [bacterium]
MTTSEAVSIFTEKYGAFVCPTNDDANDCLNQHNTNTYAYAMVADGDVVVLGEGTNGRKNVMYPGFRALSHQKVFIAAAAHHVCKNVVRLILPTRYKNEKAFNPNFNKKTDKIEDFKTMLQISTCIEEQLFKEFNFHDKSTVDKNMEYYHRRLEQLGMQENPWFTSLMSPLLRSQGSDMGGFKEWVAEWDLFPNGKGIRSYVSKILGGYYTDKGFK